MIDATDEKIWMDRLVKVLIVFCVFPTLALVCHLLLTIPALPVAYLLIRFGVSPELGAKILAVATALIACVGAIAVCKWIWPGSKMRASSEIRR